MRTDYLADPATNQRAQAPLPSLSDQAETYVASARAVEIMALELAEQDIDDEEAVAALIEAAGGDVRVMRRAHRHSEIALSDQWPAGPTLVRAFDYLSIGRRELETKQSHGSNVVVQASIEVVAESDLGRQIMEYDLVDEASLESFPASDAPSFWAR